MPTPDVLATTLYGPPAVELAVNADDTATPEAFVVAVVTVELLANSPLAPEPGAVNVTVTLGVGDPLASLTVAVRGKEKAVLILVVCGVPVVTVIVAAAAWLFVSEKLTVIVLPPLNTDPTTLYVPVVPLAVKADEVATPEPLVIAVVIAVPFANVPLTPEEGAVNVTIAPATGLLFVSVTVATSGFVKAT